MRFFFLSLSLFSYTALAQYQQYYGGGYYGQNFNSSFNANRIFSPGGNPNPLLNYDYSAYGATNYYRNLMMTYAPLQYNYEVNKALLGQQEDTCKAYEVCLAVVENTTVQAEANADFINDASVNQSLRNSSDKFDLFKRRSGSPILYRESFSRGQ